MYKRTLILLLLSFCFAGSLKAQQVCEDILPPVERYISSGDVENLSRWFDEALEITIFSRCNESSSRQARQILQAFFDSYTPTSFKISHVVEKPNLEYALGGLQAGGENFIVTIFISKKENGCLIQQMKIDKRKSRRRR